MITDTHSRENGYISLAHIDLLNMPETVTVEGQTLLKKSEFHVSIMALKNLAPMLDSEHVEQAAETLTQSFLEFAKEHDLSTFHLMGEYRLVTRAERVTIVAMVELDNISELFDYLRAKHGINFPTQPTHITIYTLQPEVGIGILSRDELINESVSVDVPALSDVSVSRISVKD